MTPRSTRGPIRWVVLALLAVLVLSGCSKTDEWPSVKFKIGEASTTIEPTLFCVNGKARFADKNAKTNALQVKPDTKVQITVPQSVADAKWTIQIWSVNDTDNGTVPLAQIGNVEPGDHTTYDGFTTSDAVPDRYFIIIAIPEDPKCDAVGSAGIWTLLVSRVG